MWAGGWPGAWAAAATISWPGGSRRSIAPGCCTEQPRSLGEVGTGSFDYAQDEAGFPSTSHPLLSEVEGLGGASKDVEGAAPRGRHTRLDRPRVAAKPDPPPNPPPPPHPPC